MVIEPVRRLVEVRLTLSLAIDWMTLNPDINLQNSVAVAVVSHIFV